MKLRAIGLAVALAPAVLQSCPPPSPSSPVNCKVVYDGLPGTEDAYGVRCDAGAFDGTTQWRVWVYFRQCGHEYCVMEAVSGDWKVPPDISIAVIPRVTYPYATLYTVGYERR